MFGILYSLSFTYMKEMNLQMKQSMGIISLSTELEDDPEYLYTVHTSALPVAHNKKC